jgi:hypothetical protein
MTYSEMEAEFIVAAEELKVRIEQLYQLTLLDSGYVIPRSQLEHFDPDVFKRLNESGLAREQHRGRDTHEQDHREDCSKHRADIKADDEQRPPQRARHQKP